MDLNALRDKDVRFAIGLMSGSSCDGVDAALVRVKGTGPGLRVKLIKQHTIPYTPGLRTRLLTARFDAHDVALLNFELGECMGEAAEGLMKHAESEDITVDFIASHGHTLAHTPPRGSDSAGTLQIGEAALIAERCGVPVVSDFRTRDIAAGGQGAPLVPYADWMLFGRKDRTVATLNIGGIANLTIVTPKFEDVIAFDTGPGNMAIDGCARFLSSGAREMDKDGKGAAKGVVIDEFLDYMLDHPYFARVPPKSTGREEFGLEVYLRDALNARKDRPAEDLMATVTAGVGYSIVRAFKRFVDNQYDVSRLIVGGGGIHNKTLMRHIKKGLPDVTLRRSDEYHIPSEAREAISFAILGNETICGTPNNVPQATGARTNVVLGKITPA
jgi:anhydro-N-acetylmuramic acid kinase